MVKEVVATKGVLTRPSGAAVAALLAAAIGMLVLAIVAWFGSWGLLHAALRRREMDLARWLLVFLVLIGVATTLIWPPVFEYLAGH